MPAPGGEPLGQGLLAAEDDQAQVGRQLQSFPVQRGHQLVPVRRGQIEDGDAQPRQRAHEGVEGADHRLVAQHQGAARKEAGVDLLGAGVEADGGELKDAVRGADIVTTVTADKRNAVILTPPMIAPGMHLNAVGGDCPGKTELHPDILRRPDVRVVVEFEPQARIEGEIQQLARSIPVIEFADVARGRVPGRCNDREITLFDSVGFALNDFSALRYLHRLNAGQPEGGQRIDLIPELNDPKDLFTGLSQERAPVRRRRIA